MLRSATAVSVWQALAMIVFAGGLLRLATLGTQGFWLDEQVTLTVIGQSPLDLLKSVQGGESNPALYYLVAAGWERVFGSSEFGVRSLSALLGTATIPVMFLAARELANERAGLAAAALTAFSPVLVWYSQEARSYALLIFLSAVTFALFARALKGGEQRWVWYWALAAGLALCTHYFAIALLLPQLVWLIAKRPGPRADVAVAAGVLLVTILALAPLIASQEGNASWIDDYDLGERLLQVPQHFIAGLEVPWAALPGLALAVAVGLGVVGFARAGSAVRRSVAIPATVCLGGLALMLIAVVGGSDYIVTRNLLELVVPFLLTVAVALTAEVLGRVGIAGIVALAGIGVVVVIWSALTPAAQRPDYAELGERIGPASQSRLIISQSGFSSPITLYAPATRIAEGSEDLTTDEIVVIEPKQTENYAVGPCWWISTCGGTDLLPPPRFAVPAGFEQTATGSTDQFDFGVYSAPAPQPIERPLEYLLPRVFFQDPPTP